MLTRIRKYLLRVDYIKRLVSDYKVRQQKQRDDELFGRLMSANYAYRNPRTKGEPFGTMTLEEYRNGRVVDRETMIIDSKNWGGTTH